MSDENSNKRYKIIYKKNECIGAFACVALEPKHWEKKDSSDVADLIEGINEGEEVYIKYLDELDNNLEAAQSCPVNCIHIIDQETGERLI